MCGITGIFNPTDQIDTTRYYKAHLKIRHRGPDDEGFLVKKKVELKPFKGDETIDYFSDLAHIKTVATASMVLGHRRLSIIDLSQAGHQPYSYKNLSVVYNGEIYNYKELREELRELGYSFETDTDTEVFLIAYHHFGNSCFEKFVGMWAAAICDDENNTLTLCRDYFGIKPLYYASVEGSIYFASEIKFLTEFEPSLKEVDKKTTYDFLVHNLKEHSKNTFYKNIKQLEPANILTISQDKMELIKLPMVSNKKMTADSNVYEAVKKSIDYHLIADVPVGISLSGGVDSTIVASYLASQKIKFQSFSSIFPEFKQFDESKYVYDTIEKYKEYIRENLIKTTLDQSWNGIDEILTCMDEPYNVLGMFQPYSIYQSAKEKGITVLLGGQGADEIFGGYKAQRKEYHKEVIRTLSLFEIFRLVRQKKINKSIIKEVLLEKNWVRKLKKLEEDKNSKGYFKGGLFEQEFNARTWYFNYGLREYLYYDDRLAMWHSIEGRVPFLTLGLYKLYAGLPYSDITNKGEQKVLLKEAFKKIMPASVYNRKDKMGYVSPQEIWMKSKEDEIKKFILNNSFFKSELKEEVVNNFNHNKLWRHYIVARWYDKIIN